MGTLSSEVSSAVRSITELSKNKADFQLLEKRAEAGDINAQFNLGVAYYYGKGVTQDKEKGCVWYRRAAEQGLLVAQYRLGCEREAEGDLIEAYKWYHHAAILGYPAAQEKLKELAANGDVVAKAALKTWSEIQDMLKKANTGDRDAQGFLGHEYANGPANRRGVPLDDKEAYKWWLKAADQGLADAQYMVGAWYCNGRGVEKDIEIGLKWLQKSIGQGNAAAQYFLGKTYAEGQGVDKNESAAFEWYQKAAEQWYPAAIVQLAWMYARGQGVSKDYMKACEWFQELAVMMRFPEGKTYLEQLKNQGVREAEAALEALSEIQKMLEKANAGDKDAQFGLGKRYSSGTLRNDQKACQWFRKAAEQGHADAQFALGIMYTYDGKNVTKDDKAGFKFFLQAAYQGHVYAGFHVACAYRAGQGVDKNESAAFEWYQKAAEKGYPDAQYIVACAYSVGQGIEQDKKKACELYQKSAAQGNGDGKTRLEEMAKQGIADAQYALGVMYANGQGVQQDSKEACEWYRKAALQGVAFAQNQLGWMYEHGQGVVLQDKKQACEWYQKSAAQGNVDGKTRLEEMAKQGIADAAEQGHAAAQGLQMVNHTDVEGLVVAKQRETISQGTTIYEQHFIESIAQRTAQIEQKEEGDHHASAGNASTQCVNQLPQKNEAEPKAIINSKNSQNKDKFVRLNADAAKAPTATNGNGPQSWYQWITGSR